MVSHTFRSRLWGIVDRLQSPLLRFGLIAATLALAAGIGYLAGRGRFSPLLILGAMVALLGGLALYRLGRFEHGVLLMLVAANALGPVTIPTGTYSQIPISLALAGGLLALWVLPNWVTRRPVRLRPSPLNAPIFAFAAVNVVSYIWGSVFRDAVVYVWGSFPVVQIAALTLNILMPLLILLIANKITELKWLKAMTWIMIGLGVHAILAIFFNLPTIVLIQRGAGGLFATWVVALAYGQALFDEKAPRWRRALLLLLVVAWIYRNFIQSRIWLSGWIPLFVACGVITFLRSRKLFLLVVLIVAVNVALDFDRYYQDIFVANADEGGLQRLELWQKNLQHVANHPLFGMGPAGYAVYNMTYHPEDARSTHNNYFDILAQTGGIGLVIFVWLALMAAWITLRTYLAASGRRNFEAGFAAAVVGGWAAALVAMMLGDWVIPFAYNGTIASFDHAGLAWIFVGAAVSLGHLVNAPVPGKGVDAGSPPGGDAILGPPRPEPPE